MAPPSSRVYHVVLPELHVGQRKVAQAKARFKVVAAGRRWGKTALGIHSSLETLFTGDNSHTWWVAPNYPMSQIEWREFCRIVGIVPFVTIKESRREIRYKTNYLGVKSADDPDSLRGEGLDKVVLNEAAFMRERAWEEGLRPALSDRKGQALFLSTPRGQNYFYRLYVFGLQRENSFRSWHFKSAENPLLDPAEIEAAKQTLPRDVFAQEFEAEFLADAAAVFRGIDACIIKGEGFLPPQQGHVYVTGWDPAKFEDFNAVVVLDMMTRRIVFMERSHRIDLITQLERVREINRRYPGFVMADITRDEALLEIGKARGVQIKGYKFTNESKSQLVMRLANVVELQQISIPEQGCEILVEEMRGFRYEITLAANVKYAASPGMHDDTVCALGLAVIGAGPALVYEKDKGSEIYAAAYGVSDVEGYAWEGL